jgi:hypothetical protein
MAINERLRVHAITLRRLYGMKTSDLVGGFSTKFSAATSTRTTCIELVIYCLFLYQLNRLAARGLPSTKKKGKWLRSLAAIPVNERWPSHRYGQAQVLLNRWHPSAGKRRSTR